MFSTQYDIIIYCMAKIYCHINQSNASVQYFAKLYNDRHCTLSGKPSKLKIHTL